MHPEPPSQLSVFLYDFIKNKTIVLYLELVLRLVEKKIKGRLFKHLKSKRYISAYIHT